ncbi:hypothetical protein [Pseudoxanthomonas sp. UTMC 1351]|uniref:hypothetical protein n=1 Tax=Pseudoxanthomonas sp. UTMC 1351 TaxID=2695853 RepID=UPI0034CD5706
MLDFQTKLNNTSGSAGRLTAEEFNNLASENENAVRRAALPLSSNLADTTQLAQAMAIAGRSAAIFNDVGSANVVELTPHAGANTFPLPPNFTGMDGNAVTFRPAAANTGPAVLNLGMTTSTLLGARPLVRPDGAALGPGDIKPGGYVTAIYDASINRWRLAQISLTLDSVPTPPVGSNDQSVANTAWVNQAIAAALGPIVAEMANKLDKVTPADQTVAGNVTFNGIVSLP